jgi:hypothetical protein
MISQGWNAPDFTQDTGTGPRSRPSRVGHEKPVRGRPESRHGAALLQAVLLLANRRPRVGRVQRMGVLIGVACGERPRTREP